MRDFFSTPSSFHSVWSVQVKEVDYSINLVVTYDSVLGFGREAEDPVLPGIDSVLEVVGASQVVDLVAQALE